MATSVVMLPAVAFGGEPDLAGPRDEVVPAISNGNVATTCQFPTTALLNGCTGTLVHPQLVTTAAHCPSPTSIRLGESQGNVARQVPVDFCVKNPNWDPNLNNGVNGEDAHFCVLSQPVTDIPLAPVAYGCELFQLDVKQENVHIVGFGNSSDAGGFGTKRWIKSYIQVPIGPGSKYIYVGRDDADSCSGDSGGPAYAKLADGFFRTFGITSGGPQGCGNGGGLYVLIAGHLQWIEATSGIDITPCFDDQGFWAPTAECGSFSADPFAGGTWSNGCDHPRSGYSQACGAPYGETTPDPSISITGPVDQDEFDGPTAEVPITFEISHPWPAREVRLLVDGEVVGTDTWPPFEFETAPKFPEGAWSITVEVEDWAGGIGSDTVNIGVGTPPDPPGTSGSGSGDGDGGTNGSDTMGGDDLTTSGDDLPPNDDGNDGSGCSVSNRSPRPLAATSLCFLIGGLGLRRRRQRLRK